MVVMNHIKYLDKYCTILDLNQFNKLGQGTKCFAENKVQRTLKKIKSTMP